MIMKKGQKLGKRVMVCTKDQEQPRAKRITCTVVNKNYVQVHSISERNKSVYFKKSTCTIKRKIILKMNIVKRE